MEIENRAKGELFGLFAEVAQGLANPKRLELLDLLAQSERTVESLALTAGLSVGNTSAHLQTLRRAGLVARRSEGTWIHYRLAGGEVTSLLLALQGVAQRHHAGAELARRARLGPDADDLATRSMSGEELAAGVKAGTLLLLDVRPGEEFAAGHIPGAESVPVSTLAERIERIAEDIEVVAYCRGAYCVMSYDAVRILRDLGRNASVLEYGMLEWHAAGRPVETAA